MTVRQSDIERAWRYSNANARFVLRARLKDALIAAIDDSHGRISKQLLALGEIARGSHDKPGRKEMHQQLAVQAQRVTLDAYRDNVEAVETPAGRTHYRAGAVDNKKKRYAGGKLRRALESPEMFEARSDGISFIDVDFLDKEAAHWARLNFGAGSRGEGAAPRTNVVFGTLVVASMGLDYEASASFVLPWGFYIDPESGKRVTKAQMTKGRLDTSRLAFYPSGERPPGIRGRPQRGRQTRGIVARHFLDAGVASIAENLGAAYEGYYRAKFRDFQAGTGPLKRVSVRPRPQRLSGYTFQD